jgi:hypothetical protein
MEQLQNLNQSALVDLLAEYTARYSKLKAEGGTKEEFNHCVLTIKYLTAVIESKKKGGEPDSEVIGNPQTTFFKE